MRKAPLLLLAFCAFSSFAQDRVAEVSYVEGYPEVVRDGQELFDTVDFGFAIENFDLVRTSDNSTLDIRIDPNTGIDATLVVEPQTQLYLDISSLRREQTGTVQMVTGAIQVTARRLTGQSRLDILCGTAAMGVRGTVFSVTTAVGGELLICADEGEVEVSTESGELASAVPGEAVEVDAEGGVRRLLYAGARQVFRNAWLREREEAFLRRAPELLAYHGRLYLEARELFVDRYAELMSHRSILDRWVDENRRGILPALAARLESRERLLDPLLRMRAVMVVFERHAAALTRMAPYVASIAAEVEIRPGISGAQLLVMVENDARITDERRATIRQGLKLYALRNDGVAPRVLRRAEAAEDTPEDLRVDAEEDERVVDDETETRPDSVIDSQRR
jgi:hypothetical protein